MDPISAVSNVVNSIIERIFPDKTQQDAAKAQLNLAIQAGELDLLKGQIDVNKAEAANSSLFVSGWRPAVGWTCALALAYNDVLAPFLGFAAHLAGSSVPLPSVPLADTMPVLLGLLGLGAMRTYEKVNGVNSGH